MADRWFMGPIRRRSGQSTLVGVDVTVAGRFYGGGRWHGPLTAQQVADLGFAGFGGRIFEGELSSVEMSNFENALPVLDPDPVF